MIQINEIFRSFGPEYIQNFGDEMKKTSLYASISSEVWKLEWNINCQAIGSSEQSVKYLAAYVFKVAISDGRIVKVEDRKVFFRYKKRSSERWRTMHFDVMEFLRRFLQHVLPTGFMKIRYYGFLHPSSSVKLEEIRELIEISSGLEIVIPDLLKKHYIRPILSALLAVSA